MPGRVCWFCERFANMTFQHGRGSEVHYPFVDVMGVYSCDSCGHLSMGLVRIDRNSDGLRGGVESALHELEGGIGWLPPKAVGKEFPDVPPAIASAASEVHECLSIRAHRAAIAVARAVVEATAKDKKITKGTLFDKIDALHTGGFIREHTRQAAHEVRLDGNAIAHGDLTAEPPDASEAEEVVTLMDELLAEVYQGPARVARVRAGRARRQTEG